MKTLLVRLTRAEPPEIAAALWAFVYFFALLAGYYVLRPIRNLFCLALFFLGTPPRVIARIYG